MSYDRAVLQQQDEALEADCRAGRRFPRPHRITMALDLRKLDGPEVDTACLAREPDVDNWELGTSSPTWEQLSALAQLTDFPISFFFVGFEPSFAGPLLMCGPGGCQVVETPAPKPAYNPHEPLARVLPLRRRS